MTDQRFNPLAADKRWQERWASAGTFEADDASQKPRSYVLEMFPYPSGRIHMGHVRNYTMGDVLARYKRMPGMKCSTRWVGTRSACRRKTPRWKRASIPANGREPISQRCAPAETLGFALDWSRELATCEPDYYGQEQALFIDLFEAGWSIARNRAVNWDPVDMTVLANEQVIDGKGWRSGALVEKRKLSQWFSQDHRFCRRSAGRAWIDSRTGPTRCA